MNKNLNKIVAEEMEKATLHMIALLEKGKKDIFTKEEVVSLFEYTWGDYIHKNYKDGQ